MKSLYYAETLFYKHKISGVLHSDGWKLTPWLMPEYPYLIVLRICADPQKKPMGGGICNEKQCLEPESCMVLIALLDFNGDGYINFREFTGWMDG